MIDIRWLIFAVALLAVMFLTKRHPDWTNPILCAAAIGVLILAVLGLGPFRIQ